MNRQTSHVSKSIQERSAYQRYITRIAAEPTLDESLDLKASTEPGEELSKATSTRKRPIKFQTRVKDYISSNWFNWLMVIIGIVLLFNVYDSRVNFALMDYKLSDQKSQIEMINNTIQGKDSDQQKQIDRISTISDDNTKLINALNLLITELKIRIEFIEQKIGN